MIALPAVEVRDGKKDAVQKTAQHTAQPSNVSFENHNQGFQAASVCGTISGLTFGLR